jgi:hypothetical protein
MKQSDLATQRGRVPALPGSRKLNAFVSVEIRGSAGAQDCLGWTSQPGTVKDPPGWRGHKRFFQKRFFQYWLSRQSRHFQMRFLNRGNIPVSNVSCPRQPVAPLHGSSFVNNNLPA